MQEPGARVVSDKADCDRVGVVAGVDGIALDGFIVVVGRAVGAPDDIERVLQMQMNTGQ